MHKSGAGDSVGWGDWVIDVNVIGGRTGLGLLLGRVSIKFRTELVESFPEASDGQAEQWVVDEAILQAFDMRSGGSVLITEVGYDSSTNVDEVGFHGSGGGVHGGAEAV